MSVILGLMEIQISYHTQIYERSIVTLQFAISKYESSKWFMIEFNQLIFINAVKLPSHTIKQLKLEFETAIIKYYHCGPTKVYIDWIDCNELLCKFAN